MKKLHHYVYLLILSASLTSCGAQWHLKKAIKKDPSILEVKTVVVTDTIVTAPVSVRDTVTLQQRDTITITKDRLKVKIVRAFDTIMIDATCESDTIIQVIEVPVPSLVMKDSDNWYNKVYKFAFYLLLLLLLVRFLRKHHIL
jgi:hypothetical protein|tara:strand:- start:5081 stop:5509 length:429 start_codon:yes stop_codon:yes gene_type:complete